MSDVAIDSRKFWTKFQIETDSQLGSFDVTTAIRLCVRFDIQFALRSWPLRTDHATRSCDKLRECRPESRIARLERVGGMGSKHADQLRVYRLRPVVRFHEFEGRQFEFTPGLIVGQQIDNL